MKSPAFLPTVILAGILIYLNSFIIKARPTETELENQITLVSALIVKDTRNTQELSEEQKAILEKWKGQEKSLLKVRTGKTEIYITPIRYSIFAAVYDQYLKIFPKNRKRDFSMEDYCRKLYLAYLRFLKIFLFRYHFYLIPAAILVIFSLILLKTGAFSSASALLRMNFFIARLLLIIPALVTLLSWLLVYKNFWVNSGLMIFLAPFAVIVASCFSLKIYDPNFPIWNRLIKSMVYPVAAAILMCGNQFLVFLGISSDPEKLTADGK